LENNADSSVVVAIAEKVGPSVVGISVKSTTSISDFWFFTTKRHRIPGFGHYNKK